MADVTFTFVIDWDSDDDWDESYEDVSLYVKSANWRLGMSKPNALIASETRLTLMLNNTDKRFSPENTSSPYYGEMLPQRKVRVQSTFLGTTRTMYVGWVDTIEPEGGDGRTVAIRCTGAKQFFQDQTIRLPLLQDLRSDEVIEQILIKLQTPPALSGQHWVLGLAGASELGETTYLADLSPSYSLDTGNTTFPYIADNWEANFHGNQYVGETWEAGFKGFDAIKDVVTAERGRFFFDRTGKAIFWNRARLQTNITLDATFDNEHTNADYHYGEDIINDVTVKVYPRAIDGSDTVLWELEEEIELRKASKTTRDKTIRANFNDADSGVEVAALNAYIDTITFTGDVDYDAEFDSTSAKITLTNLDNVKNTVSAIVIKGKKVRTYDTIEAQIIDGASRTAYGWREYVIDSKLQADLNLAESIADYEIYRRKTPYGAFHSIEVQGVDNSRKQQIVTRTIGDRIRVIDDQLDHDGEYFIIGEGHTWGLREGYKVRWTLERADTRKFWVLGETGFGELGEATYLGL